MRIQSDEELMSALLDLRDLGSDDFEFVQGIELQDPPWSLAQRERAKLLIRQYQPVKEHPAGEVT